MKQGAYLSILELATLISLHAFRDASLLKNIPEGSGNILAPFALQGSCPGITREYINHCQNVAIVVILAGNILHFSQISLPLFINVVYNVLSRRIALTCLTMQCIRRLLLQPRLYFLLADAGCFRQFLNRSEPCRMLWIVVHCLECVLHVS